MRTMKDGRKGKKNMYNKNFFSGWVVFVWLQKVEIYCMDFCCIQS